MRVFINKEDPLYIMFVREGYGVYGSNSKGVWNSTLSCDFYYTQGDNILASDEEIKAVLTRLWKLYGGKYYKEYIVNSDHVFFGVDFKGNKRLLDDGIWNKEGVINNYFEVMCKQLGTLHYKSAHNENLEFYKDLQRGVTFPHPDDKILSLKVSSKGKKFTCLSEVPEIEGYAFESLNVKGVAVYIKK